MKSIQSIDFFSKSWLPWKKSWCQWIRDKRWWCWWYSTSWRRLLRALQVWSSEESDSESELIKEGEADLTASTAACDGKGTVDTVDTRKPEMEGLERVGMVVGRLSVVGVVGRAAARRLSLLMLLVGLGEADELLARVCPGVTMWPVAVGVLPV